MAPQSYVEKVNLKKMILEYFASPDRFDPREFISILKNDPDLNNDFPKSVGVEEVYSLEQHTFMVLRQFETYFARQVLPGGLKPNFFRMLLALHDAGKPRAVRERNRAMEHPYTLALINKLKADLPFNDAAIEVMCALIKKDVIGMYLRDKLSLQGAISQINLLSENLKIPVFAFFQLLTIFYQCDTSSYTADAGGVESLEFLYAYQNGRKIYNSRKLRLEFAPETEYKFSFLESKILSQPQKRSSLVTSRPSPQRIQERSA